MNKMKKIINLLLLITLYIIGINSIANVYAYWGGILNYPTSIQNTITIQIGNGFWTNIYDGIPIIEEMTIEEEKEVYEPGTLLLHEGYLYMVRENYQPYWHGLPDQYIPWAVFSLNLEWRSGTNYRTNSIVAVNGRWFIANYVYSTDWYTNSPLIYSGAPHSEWREIEPVDENDFGLLPGTNIKDYRLHPDDVTYK